MGVELVRNVRQVCRAFKKRRKSAFMSVYPVWLGSNYGGKVECQGHWYLIIYFIFVSMQSC